MFQILLSFVVFWLSFKIIMNFFREEQGFKENFLFLQGSASYLIIKLGLDGKIVNRSDLLRRCQDLIDAQARTIQQGIPTELSVQDTANAVMMMSFMERNSNIENFYSQRKMKDAKGNPLYPQLWFGYSIMFGVSRKEDGPVLVEIGSGQVKIFHAGQPVEMMDFSGIEDESPFNIGKFMEKLKSDSGRCAFDYLEYFLPADLQGLEKVYFGTAGLRKLEEESGEKIEKIHVLTQEEEARCEAYAADHCTSICDNFDLENFTYTGNFGWGNGSGQGFINGRFVSPDCGLKKIMKSLGAEEGKKFASFGDQEDFKTTVSLATLVF